MIKQILIDAFMPSFLKDETHADQIGKYYPNGFCPICGIPVNGDKWYKQIIDTEKEITKHYIKKSEVDKLKARIAELERSK